MIFIFEYFMRKHTSFLWINRIEYYKNGNKRYEGNFKNGKFHGKGILYYLNGKKHYEGNWENSKKHGKGIQYSLNGKKLCEGDFGCHR